MDFGFISFFGFVGVAGCMGFSEGLFQHVGCHIEQCISWVEPSELWIIFWECTELINLEK